MIERSSRHLTLRQLVFLSWLVPGTLVVFASMIAFFAAGWMDYRSATGRIQDDLFSKSRVVSRRLSAELLLGSSGAAEPVARTLEGELGLAKIDVFAGEPSCARGPRAVEVCWEQKDGSLTVFRRMELVKDLHYVAVSQRVTSYVQSLKPSLFLWSALPVLVLLGIGLLFQRRLLDRFLIQPISSLVDTSVHAKDLPSEWPSEIRDISQRLTQTFEDRDQAIFGRVAGGVIHDIKTLLHSVLNAGELVRELPADSPKRAVRLEGLLKATSINVPKMLNIIELTLDGTREIPIRKKGSDLLQTVRSAIEVNEHLAKGRGVGLLLEADLPTKLAHDPIQLERALTNLIRNGVEAFDALVDEPCTRERLVRVRATQSGSERIALWVEDSGPGLPYGTDRAFRLLRSTKVHGSGLGLFVTRKIIEGHGGRIEARKSEDLHGAAFLIELPAGEGVIV